MSGYSVCPFNRYHRILPAHFRTHIYACQQNYPDVKISFCKHNASHVVLERDIEEHVRTCPDKIYAEREAMKTLAAVRSVNFTPTLPEPPKDDGEDWGATASTDVPFANKECEALFRKAARQPPNKMSRTLKEAWRKAEICRMSKLHDNEPIFDIQFPNSAGEYYTIAEMIDHMKKKQNKRGLSDRTTAFQDQAMSSMLSTAEPLQAKGLTEERAASAASRTAGCLTTAGAVSSSGINQPAAPPSSVLPATSYAPPGGSGADRESGSASSDGSRGVTQGSQKHLPRGYGRGSLRRNNDDDDQWQVVTSRGQRNQ